MVIEAVLTLLGAVGLRDSIEKSERARQSLDAMRIRQCETRRKYELGTRALEHDQLTSADLEKFGELLKALIAQVIKSKTS